MTSRPVPQTLAEIAGLSRIPSDPSKSVLLLIDAQREYTTGKVPLMGMAAAVKEAARLLDWARKQRMPVFHAIHHGRPGSALFDPDGEGSAFIDELAPQDGETVLTKSLPNAFAGTRLADLVRGTGRSEIIIAGFATHMCVSATARSALDNGFRNTVVAAATATRDLPHPSGRGVSPATWIQEATLAALSDRFSVVVQDTAELLQGGARAA